MKQIEIDGVVYDVVLGADCDYCVLNNTPVCMTAISLYDCFDYHYELPTNDTNPTT